MTDDEMRVAIAEACGWRRAEPGQMMPYMWAPGHVADVEIKWMRGKLSKAGDGLQCAVELPDYLNDLNAMHEAEKTLALDQRDIYQRHLYRVRERAHRMAPIYWLAITATARQRAEAFLATKNLPLRDSRSGK